MLKFFTIGAYDARGLAIEDRFFAKSPANNEGTKKLVFTTDSEEKNLCDSLENDSNEHCAQKHFKTFVIKHKKCDKGGDLRKNSLELESPKESPRHGGACPSSAGQSPTNIRITHVPSRFSFFRADSERVKTIEMNDKRINEEGKSDFCGEPTRKFIIGESCNEENVKTSKNGFHFKQSKEALSHEDTKPIIMDHNRNKRNNIILRKDSQVNFNVKLGDILGEGKSIKAERTAY